MHQFVEELRGKEFPTEISRAECIQSKVAKAICPEIESLDPKPTPWSPEVIVECLNVSAYKLALKCCPPHHTIERTSLRNYHRFGRRAETNGCRAETNCRVPKPGPSTALAHDSILVLARLASS